MHGEDVHGKCPGSRTSRLNSLLIGKLQGISPFGRARDFIWTLADRYYQCVREQIPWVSKQGNF
jgi:hypothetical protein